MTAQSNTYCMSCFSLIPVEAGICPVCGEDIASWSAHDFKEKLLHSLYHPSDEVRKRVIAILAQRREKGTALQLAECALRHPSYDEAIEIVRALKEFQDIPEGRRALEILAQDHSGRAVRVAAQAALNIK